MNLDKNVFIKGQLINLRKPNIQADIINGNWAEWFNDPKVTKYLIHGTEHNTKEKQVKLIESEIKKDNVLILVIANKETNKNIGVISLKDIDNNCLCAEIAIVMGFDKYEPGAPLEAMGLLTQYAFEKLNLNRLYAGQHVGLWKWVNTLELIGYQLTGYIKDAQKKYDEFNDIVTMSCLKQTYNNLINERGSYLTDDISKLCHQRPKENKCEKLKCFIESLYL